MLFAVQNRLDTRGHAVADRIAGAGGYATLEGGVVSIRQSDGKVLLEMTVETWGRLGQKEEISCE